MFKEIVCPKNDNSVTRHYDAVFFNGTRKWIFYFYFFKDQPYHMKTVTFAKRESIPVSFMRCADKERVFEEKASVGLTQ